MLRTRLAVLCALAFVGCLDAPDVFFEANPPDVVVNYDCPCLEGSCEHVVNITEEVYPTETVYVTEEDTTPDVVQEFYGDASSLPVLLWSGIGEPMPKKLTDLTAATALADADQFVIEQSGTSKRIAADAFSLPFNYIAGLITSNDTDADHDIAIAPGVARSADDVTNLKLAAILTKQIDAAWAVGDDAGGLDTGSVANGVYAIWLIKRSDTGVVDALFSLSFTAPTMPADYDSKRLIGAVVTAGTGNIVQYVQADSYFRLLAVQDDVDDSSITSGTYETGTLSAPPNSLAHIYAGTQNPTGTDIFIGVCVKQFAADDSSNAQEYFAGQVNSSDPASQVYGNGMVLVNADRQMKYAGVSLTGAASVFIRTLGFTMLTRRDP